jgi:hypothetical protein
MGEGLKDAIYDCAKNGAVEEFKKILKQFGADTKMLDLMGKAIKDGLKYEDGGSFCENATSGYYALTQKQALLRKAYLKQPDTILSGEFQNAVTYATLLEKISQLEEKLAKIEGGGKKKTSHNNL